MGANLSSVSRGDVRRRGGPGCVKGDADLATAGTFFFVSFGLYYWSKPVGN